MVSEAPSAEPSDAPTSLASASPSGKARPTTTPTAVGSELPSPQPSAEAALPTIGPVSSSPSQSPTAAKPSVSPTLVASQGPSTVAVRPNRFGPDMGSYGINQTGACLLCSQVDLGRVFRHRNHPMSFRTPRRNHPKFRRMSHRVFQSDVPSFIAQGELCPIPSQEPKEPSIGDLHCPYGRIVLLATMTCNNLQSIKSVEPWLCCPRKRKLGFMPTQDILPEKGKKKSVLLCQGLFLLSAP